MQKGSRGTLILVIGILSMASATYFAAYLLVISSFAPISEPVQSIALTVVSCFQGRSREPTAGGSSRQQSWLASRNFRLSPGDDEDTRTD